MKNVMRFIVAVPTILITQGLLIEGVRGSAILVTLAICLFAYWILSDIIVDIAKSKHFTNLTMWRVIGFFFFPIAFICVVVKDAKPDLIDTKVCPHCFETIKKEAKFCHWCGHDVE